ncbi:MAG: S24/S26 family peptidase [Clostridia bacterium]|nr:S24/S26 family peptidase [Clostridia bacterium]
MDNNFNNMPHTDNIDVKTLEDILKEKGVFLWTTRGKSMRPLLKTNRDIVEIRRPDTVYEDGILKVGDVALYTIPIPRFRGQYVLHRVRRVCDGYYIICGDNNVSMEKVPFSWVIGVMTGLTRRGKNVDLNGAAYKIYVRHWGSRYRRRVVAKRIGYRIKRPLIGPYRAVRKLLKGKR